MYQGPVDNSAAEKGVSSIPYVGPIISAFIGIGDFAANGRNFAWAQGTTPDDRHSEGVPQGLVETRDYYWEYGTWVYSGTMIEKFKIANILLGDKANQLSPSYLGATSVSQLQSDLLSTQPATYVAPQASNTSNVYV